VGRTLVRVLEELLFELGAQVINVMVDREAAELEDFWKAMQEEGYRPCGQPDRYTKGPGEPQGLHRWR
jgi:hypothetical protein